jgi:hypothetical protein
MFQNCESLLSVPFIDTSRAASFNLMFSGCVSLLRIPNLDTSLVTSWTSAFNGCDSLERIPALNMVVANTMTTTFSGCASIGSNKMFNIGVSFGVGAEKLSKTNLEEIFDNMLRNNVTATITITTNPGADTAVVKTISITAGQTVITPPNMTGIVNGMWVTGPNIGNTTFDISGTTLTKTAHGLPDGTKVAFLSTTGVSGATNRTIYYVVNGTADTIQLSTTYPAVTLVPITGTGTGSLGYPVQIIAVGGSTYTIDKPVGTTGSGSISHRLLNTTYAVLKGWTVTG